MLQNLELGATIANLCQQLDKSPLRITYAARKYARRINRNKFRRIINLLSSNRIGAASLNIISNQHLEIVSFSHIEAKVVLDLNYVGLVLSSSEIKMDTT